MRTWIVFLFNDYVIYRAWYWLRNHTHCRACNFNCPSKSRFNSLDSIKEIFSKATREVRSEEHKDVLFYHYN